MNRLHHGYPDKEPRPADYGLDPYSGFSIHLFIHQQFEREVLAKARGLAPTLPVGLGFAPYEWPAPCPDSFSI